MVEPRVESKVELDSTVELRALTCHKSHYPPSVVSKISHRDAIA